MAADVTNRLPDFVPEIYGVIRGLRPHRIFCTIAV
jgi:hypothetical protein